MTTRYTLRIETEVVPRLWMRVEVGGDATLHELELQIERTWELARSDNYAFYRSGFPHDLRTQFSGADVESEYYADETPIGRLALRVGSRMAHVADVDAAAWSTILVEAVVSGAPKLDAPRALGRGETVLGPREVARLALVRRIDVELVQDKESSAGPASSPESLAVLARDIYAFASNDRAELATLSNAASMDLESWLLDLPTFFAAHDRIEEALELSERGAAVFEPLQFAADRARILVQVGRRDEARAIVRKISADSSAEGWSLIHAGEVLHLTGDSAEGEALLRRAIEALEDDPETQDFAREALADMWRQLGRHAEADSMRPVRSALDIAEEELLESPLAAANADIGRNDPCPCGSGKKFKKCCDGPSAMPVRTDADCVSDLFVETFEFVCTSAYAAEFALAIPCFAGPEFVGLSLHDTVPLMPTDDAFEALLWWFVFDRTLDDGKTPADRFIEKRGKKLSSAQRSAFEGMKRSHLALTRHSVEPGSGSRLEDLITGEIATFGEVLPLEDPLAITEFVRPIRDHHVVRILHLSTGPVLAPTVLFTSDTTGIELEKRVRDEFDDLRREHPNAKPAQLAKSHGDRVYRAWLDVTTAPTAKG